ncbi:MAG TPA: AmmeMemoRadiSam system radical SAM enzyme [Acidobacteriota bacterium]|nr:AmmeMemoRadiSam system radical SAM enzyme [Acidobacteriota bacterium]
MMHPSRREFLRSALTGGAALLAASSPAAASSTESLRGGRRQDARGKEAMFYAGLSGNRVRCELCNNTCTIEDGGTGFCRVRQNRGGTLYSLVYGRPAGLQIDPIEMEPMYHMLPGHSNLCVFTASCNFRCRHCHNWHISQKGPDEIVPESYSPSEVVEAARKKGCKSISHSINEPTVFYEYMYDISRQAKAEGLLTLFHTNGYMSPTALRNLLRHIDGVTVDLKAFHDRFYREISSASLAPVLKTLRIIREENVHLEIVYLMIPTLNDDLSDIEKMCAWITEHLGKDVPVHFNRFTPRYKLSHLPSTPVRTLEEAAATAFASGLKYVYVGNVPGHKHSSTYCPRCKERLIHRTHSSVLSNHVEKGSCKFCGYAIRGIWEKPRPL